VSSTNWRNVRFVEAAWPEAERSVRGRRRCAESAVQALCVCLFWSFCRDSGSVDLHAPFLGYRRRCAAAQRSRTKPRRCATRCAKRQQLPTKLPSLLLLSERVRRCLLRLRCGPCCAASFQFSLAQCSGPDAALCVCHVRTAEESPRAEVSAMQRCAFSCSEHPSVDRARWSWQATGRRTARSMTRPPPRPRSAPSTRRHVGTFR
jgi:hypothetical protein